MTASGKSPTDVVGRPRWDGSQITFLCLLLLLAAEAGSAEHVHRSADVNWNIRTGDALSGNTVPRRAPTGLAREAKETAFDWSTEFRDVVQRGGFDVVIGNPPYLAAASTPRPPAVRKFRTASCPDVYAWCLERVLDLGSNHGSRQ